MQFFPSKYFSFHAGLRRFPGLLSGRGFFWTLALLAFLAGWFGPRPVWADYRQLEGVVDVKSRFSDGCSSIQELANIAQLKKIDVVIFSDHDRYALEYGIMPFERIFKKKVEGASILSSGAVAYLSEINDNDKNFPDTLLIPAVESAPFYYWTGGLLGKDLVANNWDKHLLIVGLDRPEDYEQLPILNGNLSTRYTSQFMPRFLVLLVLFLASLIPIYKNYYRRLSILLMVIFFLLLVNNHPYRSSSFDQYHGNQGIAPFQEAIDYARSKNALVFWNHLESTTGMGKTGLVGLETPPHPEDLLASKNYTGFQAVYDGEIHMTEPGKEWDQVLLQYVQGTRDHPVWGYGGNDFHCEGQSGNTLISVKTVFLARDKSRESVLEAMRKGRMYALRQPEAYRLSLDEFKVMDKVSGREATLGEDLYSQDIPELNIKIRSTNDSEDTVILSIIRDGEVVKKEAASLPYELSWRDMQVKRQGAVYYRLRAEVNQENYLISNPVFVRFSQPPKPPQVASIPPGVKEPVVSEPQAKVPVEPVPPKAERPVTPKSGPPQGSPIPPEMDGPPGTQKPDSPVTASPAGPEIQKTSPPAPRPPKVAEPAPPSPAKAPPLEEQKTKFVTARINGVTLKKGPGVSFPEVDTAGKGERLMFVKRTNSMFNGKAWLEVKKGDQRVYVWEGLVRFD